MISNLNLPEELTLPEQEVRYNYSLILGDIIAPAAPDEDWEDLVCFVGYPYLGKLDIA